MNFYFFSIGGFWWKILDENHRNEPRILNEEMDLWKLIFLLINVKKSNFLSKEIKMVLQIFIMGKTKHFSKEIYTDAWDRRIEQIIRRKRSEERVDTNK